MNKNKKLKILIEINKNSRNRLELINELIYYKLRNQEIKETIKIQKNTKIVFEHIITVLLWVFLFFILSLVKAHAQFNPKDVSDLVFFVESANISTINHVAACETDFCLNHPSSESAIITEQYCDVTNSCGEGCVRRWLDQSNYMPSGGFNPPEYTSGRNFGQDDKEKPCYISNGINGKPSLRGGPAYGNFGDIDGDGDIDYKFPQDKYLEIEGPDAISLTGAFSIFLLAKPADQTATGDWSYFGLGAHYVTHRVSNNTIKLRVGNTVPPSPVVTITSPNAVQLNKWQLIEIHRDASGNITSFINGVDTTVSGANSGTGTFKVGYLLSNFKTGISHGTVSMHGDVAAFLIYNKETSTTENNNIRNYFDVNYLGNILNIKTAHLIGFKAFPNPIKDYVVIHVKQEEESHPALNDEIPRFYDILGKEIKVIVDRTEKRNYINFNVRFTNKLSKGLYWVSFKGNTIKLIKN